jgi:hypothetical protein
VDLAEDAKADSAEDAEAAFEIEDHVKSTKQHAQNAARSAKCRLSQAVIDLFIARNAIGIRNQEDSDSISKNIFSYFIILLM